METNLANGEQKHRHMVHDPRDTRGLTNLPISLVLFVSHSSLTVDRTGAWRCTALPIFLRSADTCGFFPPYDSWHGHRKTRSPLQSWDAQPKTVLKLKIHTSDDIVLTLQIKPDLPANQKQEFPVAIALAWHWHSNGTFFLKKKKKENLWLW